MDIQRTPTRERPLHTAWTLWYHSITDSSWTKSSYKELYRVDTLYSLCLMQETLRKHHLQNGMFFLMREDIFPTWEDPDNREGCCVSYKVSGDVLQEQWDFIVRQVVGEDIPHDESLVEQVTGISIAPKKEFNVVKIWLRSQPPDYTTILKEYSPLFTKSKAMVKKHELSS
jgi:hypothetical protein